MHGRTLYYAEAKSRVIGVIAKDVGRMLKMLEVALEVVSGVRFVAETRY
jgi:hypothetical protein